MSVSAGGAVRVGGSAPPHNGEAGRERDMPGGSGVHISPAVGRLIASVGEFSRYRHARTQELVEFERLLREEYGALNAPQRVEYIAAIYDIFSANYDNHMGVLTNHYLAIKKVLSFAAPYLRFPLIDPTAGTGEIVKSALDLMDGHSVLSKIKSMVAYAEGKGVGLPETDLLCGSPRAFRDRIDDMSVWIPEDEDGFNTNRAYWVYVNEVSPEMARISEAKLSDYQRINHTSYDGLELPAHLKGGFRTALCSQTFHLLPMADKARLARSLYNVLEPGGRAIVIEEDPFRVSPTPSIEPVSMLIRSIAVPVRNKGDLIGLFTNNGFEREEMRAVWPIDEHHSMRLYMFRKPDGQSNPPPSGNISFEDLIGNLGTG